MKERPIRADAPTFVLFDTRQTTMATLSDVKPEIISNIPREDHK